MLTLALAMIGLQASAVERPPVPTDAELLAAIQTERPGARVLSHEFRGSAGTPGRRICALAEIGGVVEPVAVSALWFENGITVIIDGVATPPPPPGWKISVSAAYQADLDQDGLDWRDRNLDVMNRRMALRSCPNLLAPEGVTWAVAPEPNPDPAAHARAEAQAQRITDALFPTRR